MFDFIIEVLQGDFQLAPVGLLLIGCVIVYKAYRGERKTVRTLTRDLLEYTRLMQELEDLVRQSGKGLEDAKHDLTVKVESEALRVIKEVGDKIEACRMLCMLSASRQTDQQEAKTRASEKTVDPKQE